MSVGCSANIINASGVNNVFQYTKLYMVFLQLLRLWLKSDSAVYPLLYPGVSLIHPLS